jgi:hypothetical protein
MTRERRQIRLLQLAIMRAHWSRPRRRAYLVKKLHLGPTPWASRLPRGVYRGPWPAILEAIADASPLPDTPHAREVA